MVEGNGAFRTLGILDKWSTVAGPGVCAQGPRGVLAGGQLCRPVSPHQLLPQLEAPMLAKLLAPLRLHHQVPQLNTCPAGDSGSGREVAPQWPWDAAEGIVARGDWG